MCLLLFSYLNHPKYRLVLAANRDEFYNRPTAPLGIWQDCPEVVAGRDLEQMGTWMGVTATGRFAAITNFRAPHLLRSNAPSRGHLVSDYLAGDIPPEDYLKQLLPVADQYNGFNIIVGNSVQLYYFSNHEGSIRRIETGIHGLSNHLLNKPWFKVERGKEGLARILQECEDPPDTSLLTLLQDQTAAQDDCLPDSGVGHAWEKVLSPIFIASPEYGTRSSSVLKIDLKGRIRISEYTWETNGQAPQKKEVHRFSIADGITTELF